MEDIWKNLLSYDFVTDKFTLDERIFAVKICQNDINYLRDNLVNIIGSNNHNIFVEISVSFSKSIEIIDLLIKEFKIDPVTYVDDHNDTLLIKACSHNTNIDVVKHMIDVLKINPHHLGKYLANCLHPTCRKNTNINIIKYLINDVKVDVTNLDSVGDNCLIEACRQNKNDEIVKYLIELKIFDIKCCDSDGDNIFTNSTFGKQSDYITTKYIVEKTDVGMNLKKVSLEDYKNILPIITGNYKRLNVLLNRGIDAYGIDALIPVIKTLNPLSIYSEETRCEADFEDPFELDYQEFKGHVDKLESPVSIKIKQTDMVRHQNQISIDFTNQQEILFEHNGKKYFGNKNIVYKSIILLNDVLLEKNDEPIVLSIDVPEYLINLYIQSCYCEYFMIQKLLPEDFVSFIKLIDQYPTTTVSVDRIEPLIVLYMMKNNIKKSDYLDSVVQRYSLKMIYMYLSDKLIMSNDCNSYELSTLYCLSSICYD